MKKEGSLKKKSAAWTKQDYHAFWNQLKKAKEEDFRLFSERIIKTKYPMLGIRTPLLKKQASCIAKQDIDTYLEVSEKTYFEEILVQGFVIGKIREKEKLKQAFLKFVPQIDNWAVCDMVIASLKRVAKEKPYFLAMVDALLSKKKTFYIRSGLVLLLNYYVEDAFLEEIFRRILKITSKEYYVEMAEAWLLCECFIENEEKTYTFLKESVSSFSLLSKTIQKICDSYRVTKETKEKLKQLKNQKKEELYS